MYKKALKSSFALIGINYTIYAINVIVQLLLVRLLIPDDFGTFVLILSVVEIISIFLAFDFSILVYIIKRKKKCLIHLLSYLLYLF